MHCRCRLWAALVLAFLPVTVSVLPTTQPPTTESGHFGEIVLTLPIAGAIAWGDYDKDGRIDFAIAGSTRDSAVTAIYRNVDGTRFSDIRADLKPAWSTAVCWLDIDKDGDLDLLVAGQTDSGPASTLYRNDAGRFSRVDSLAGAVFSSIAAADCNKDGRIDVAIAGTNRTRLYLNDSGKLIESPVRLAGVQSGCLAWADYNLDGLIDLAVTGEYNTGWSSVGVTRLYTNTGSGRLTESPVTIAQLSHSSLAWADYDNDGDPDLAISGFNTRLPTNPPNLGPPESVAAVSRIYRNDLGTFTDIKANLLGLGNGSVAWGDYDQDGRADLLITGMFYDGPKLCCGTRLYHNDGGDSFHRVDVELEGVHNGSAAWADYDGNGRLDLAISGMTGDGRPMTRVYRR